MARNIEIKAYVDDYQSVYQNALAIADNGPTEIHQDDTFFNCQNGRLKLRELSGAKGELIFYQRPDQNGPKQSFYQISPTSSPATLKESLTLAYGVAGRVSKKRILFLAGRTRIHLDKVEGLGDFIELEVVLDDNETQDDGILEASQLLESLAIDEAQLIDRAYVDLLNQDDTDTVQ